MNESKRARISKGWRFLPLKGHLWMIRRYGVRRWWRYERARRSGMVIDYAQVFTPDELARIGERFWPTPWEAFREDWDDPSMEVYNDA